ncbi:probable ABC1 transport protein [Rhynchosporium secalis]|uniref:Probable ABC1 transport protein n=1 Tax=Rhynchosporium secalis TaxID=38038 RepID=A0A1E1M9S0_RHYSE|nr:probable ABC1 transport protein [Rhynchosporium secalis]
MASATPFGVIHQSGAVAQTVEEKINPSEDSYTKEAGEQPSEKVHPTENSYQKETGEPISEKTGHESLSDSADEEQLKPQIHELARNLTYHSVKDGSGNYVNPFSETSNPVLDPRSDSFNYKSWMRTILAIHSRDPERYPKRVAGIAYRNLSAHGFGEATDYQKTFGNYPLEIPSLFKRIIGRRQQTKIQILRDFDGLVRSGEMLVVLGRPGSGCSTLLKTISGETDGYYIDEKSYINYQGISVQQMHNDFRGECIYQAETDVHFPQLTVGQTLEFAAKARGKYSSQGPSDFCIDLSKLLGKESQVALGGSPLQCWDNSTRGLDSATALEFVKTLRLSTDMAGSAAVVAIYQASQSIYDIFDKVAVLYEGRQIYFGEIHAAKKYFLDMGFECPKRQTTGDFLTSITSPAERVTRPGFEGRTPYTPDEFAAAWYKSDDRAQLLREIEEFDAMYPLGGPSLDLFKEGRRAAQSKSQRIKSPYTLSVVQQIKLCVQRGFQRLQGDMSLMLTSFIGNAVMALIIGSVFYNLSNETSALYSKGALLFFAILMAAFQSSLEILTLYAQRPIVEKQAKYAFYHPFAEAIASMLCDLPNKIGTAITFNLALYFMTNLRRTPENFFIFFLFAFMCTLCISMFFRSIAAMSRTLSQAMAPAALFILTLVIYTGFAIPTKNMVPWFRWLNWLNPVAYAFEALMINEFHNLKIPCSPEMFVPAGPGYENITPEQRICSTTGAQAGANFVDGDRYLMVNYRYEYSHLWRNLGIMFALMFAGCAVYLVCTEYISAKKSKGEVLLFRRGRVPDLGSKKPDEEANIDDRVNPETVLAREKTVPDAPPSIQKQTAVFHWDSVNYDIKIKKEDRRLLDDVDGWVIPGTLTALMGVSGAGKTTLLDVLASRVTMGVVSGRMLVDGRERDTGFQRKTGYVQQQDLHLATSTVREALTFSAILRQPKTVPHDEKLAYVDEVIKVLEMEAYADAVVGVPGEGLNVEQRKRLTIGVELAAKPALLLFLDEPTSGLDSQTAWSILALLRKLADNGQAILCTIHQPSAILFQEFDRLLFLARGGSTVYFGGVGKDSHILTEYFERNGSVKFGLDDNPAEKMLEVIGAAPGSSTEIDWVDVWRNSPERQAVKAELARMKETLSQNPVSEDPTALDQFAAPPIVQLKAVVLRVFQQYWRTPSYLYSKTALCTSIGLFIGFSFWDAPNSLQGLQNQLFAIFMLLTVFGNLSQQIMPHFVTQRSLYESRERPSKTYSWIIFMLSNIIVEMPWNTLMGVILFFTWYYPIGLYRNAEPTDAVTERGGLMFLFLWSFMIFAGTFTHFVVAGIETAETAGNIGNLMFSLCLIFNGVLASPDALPRFWIFMYRVSPFTYLVSGMLSTGLANTDVTCSSIEYLHINPPSSLTCGQYLDPYKSFAGGYILNPNDSTDCSFCSVADTNVFLKRVNADYADAWRNFGILWAFIVFNCFGAVGLYWLARVPKGRKKAKKAKSE